MTIRFISDLHLDASRPATCRAFFDYLQAITADTEALYILGDFFEAWIGDDDDNAFYQTIQDALKQASAQGLKLYFMHGNRDFMVGEQFAAYTGCTLLPDPFVLDYQGSQYLLMHGDSLCTDDVEYQQFRAQIRNPDMLAMLRAKPLAERREMAKQLRANSKEAASNKADDIMDVNAKAVEQHMLEAGIGQLIHGHTHRPAIHDLTLNGEAAQRWVLGDWCDKGWEIILDQNGLQLRDFTIPFAIPATSR